MLFKILKKNNFDFISFLSAFIIVFSLFGDAYFVSQYSVNLKFYGLFLFAIISIFNFKKILSAPKLIVNIALLSVFLLIISSFFWYSTRNAYSYAGIVIAYLVYTNCKKEFLYLIKWIFFISLFLSAYEFLTDQFLFDSSWLDSETGKQIIIDKKMVGGSLGVFRSKALFFGPLSLGLFVISFSLLNPTNLNYLLLSLSIAFFSGSRLAQLVIIILLINNFFQNKKNIKQLVIIILTIIVLFVFKSFFSSNFLVSLERSLQLFDVNQSDNASRIGYWLKSINLYLDYSYINLIFGDNGRFYSLYYTGNESGWLSLFIDNGLVGFIFYFFILIYSFKNGSHYLNSRTRKIILFILIFVMSVITFHLSAINNLLFWLIIFIQLGHKINFKKYQYLKNKNSTGITI